MKRNSILPALLLWVFINSVWLIYRYIFTNPEWIDEGIYKQLIFILPVLIYEYRKKSLNAHDLGLQTKNKREILFWGIGFGGFLVFENLLVSFFKQQQLRTDILVPAVLFTNLGVSLVTAFSEELLYRGFLLRELQKNTQSNWKANFVCALLFSLGHVGVSIFSLHYAGAQLLSYLFLVFVLGVANGYIYQRTGSVYASTLSHTLWNFSVSMMVVSA